MNKLVYVLQTRYSGEEDEVFLFTTKKAAEKHVFKYFEGYDHGLIDVEEFEEYLWSNDIGYFSIYQANIIQES